MQAIPLQTQVEPLGAPGSDNSPTLGSSSLAGESTVAALGLLVILALFTATATAMPVGFLGWKGLWLAPAPAIAVAAALRHYFGRTLSAYALLRLTAATVLIGGGSIFMAAFLLVGIISAVHGLVDSTKFASASFN